jgi:S-DNA-T family DNA segregation ATPase FtsK/SpoIIIE
MIVNGIIGRVGADVLKDRIEDARQSDGSLPDTAGIFRLDRLSPAQIAAVVREIYANPDLAGRIDVKIPATLLEGETVPPQATTSLNAGAIRNGGTDREALLTANGNEHNLADTLGHVTALGAKELRSNVDAWVEATCRIAGIAPTPDDRLIFKAALKGLLAAGELSLNQLAEFCAGVAEGNQRVSDS